MRALAAVLAFLASCQVTGEDVTPPVVQRGRFSVNTRTTTVGTVDVENGLLQDFGEGQTVSTLVRYGATPASEMFVGGDLYRLTDSPNAEGFGDLVLGFRHRFWDQAGAHPSFALQLEAKVPTADAEEGLGSGEQDLALALFSDRIAADVRLTAFGELALLGDPNADGTDPFWTFALAAVRPEGRLAQTYGELAYLHSKDRDTDALNLSAGFLVPLGGRLVVDLGARLGFFDADDFALQIGLTTNLGQPTRLR